MSAFFSPLLSNHHDRIFPVLSKKHNFLRDHPSINNVGNFWPHSIADVNYGWLLIEVLSKYPFVRKCSCCNLYPLVLEDNPFFGLELFKGENYSRVETIRGITVSKKIEDKSPPGINPPPGTKVFGLSFKAKYLGENTKGLDLRLEAKKLGCRNSHIYHSNHSFIPNGFPTHKGL